MDARVIGWLLLVALMGTPVPRLAAALERDGEPAATEPAEPEEEKAWPVYLHFGWDDGIVYEAGNRVHLPMRGTLRLFESDAIVSGRIGARLHLDAAVFASTGGLDVPGPRMQVRRGYFNFVGDVHTKVPLRYAVEVGFNQNRLFVDKS